jgi:hypothetical protein
MHAGVDFRMEFRALRNAVQGIDLRQHRGQAAARMQRAQERRGPRRCERARQFLPDAFGHQVGQLAGRGHRTHQRHRLRCDLETEWCKARHEPGGAQHPQRVLGKRRADVAQDARFDVARAAERIEQRAVGRLRDRIDGEVATLQVLFQRHRRIGVDHEAAISPSTLALGARECVFLVAVRMQEHREVATDRLEAAREHCVLGFSDDDKIPIARPQAEQLVAHCAADEIDLHCLHAAMMPRPQALPLAWQRWTP